MAKCGVVLPHCSSGKASLSLSLSLLHPHPNRHLHLNLNRMSFSFSSINKKIDYYYINKEQAFCGQKQKQKRGGLIPPSAVDSDKSKNEKREQWDSLTAKFSGASNIPFLLLQLPQIILNARNLISGNKSALLAVPWLGMLTGVLGNLSLLSYFSKKREKEVIVVQTLGVLSQYVVFAQLAMADAMPLPFFLITSLVVLTGLVVNFLNYFYLLNPPIWRFWEDFITIGGLSALPQVMWSTFVPYLPNSIFPGALAFLLAVAAVIMVGGVLLVVIPGALEIPTLCIALAASIPFVLLNARLGKLSEEGIKFVGGISGWTATLLFMWMPVSQMWTNFLNPNNIKGLSAFSMLLAMIGNGLMIPRALFTRDFMWFLGSSWASFFYGYGNIVCLYWFNSISKEFFLAATTGLFLWIGMALWRDAVVHGYSSPFTSLRELIFGA